MPTDIDHLRSELEGKFQPPVDVMLDPSLLVATTSLERLEDSTVFDAQTQATLGSTPTQPRIDSLHVPKSFRGLLDANRQVDSPSAMAWNFYRGQADSATPSDIAALLEARDVRTFDDKTESAPNWNDAPPEIRDHEQMVEMLDETYAFLMQGGVLLSRTPSSLDALRDASVATIDVGSAGLAEEIHEPLLDIGFETPVANCAFGVSSSPATVNALVGSLLADSPDGLVYRFSQ